MSIADNLSQLHKCTNIEFSTISGYNYYLLPEDQSPGQVITALHVPSDTQVYLVPIQVQDAFISPQQVQWHRQFILKPMPTDSYEWPIDLIQSKTSMGRYVLFYVFPLRTFSNHVPIRKILYQKKDSKVLDWREPGICTLCRNLLETFAALEESGYRYNDFSMDRILYHESTGHILLRHTMQIRTHSNASSLDRILPEKIAPEFAPALLYKSSYSGYLPEHSDRFSLASLLFRLMIGRLPYEGRGLSNYGDILNPIRDVDETSHNNYFQHYHKFPFFIFSREDDSNRLAPMQENDRPKERWETLPTPVQDMFCATFAPQVAEGKASDGLYSARQWLDACNTYCWNTEEFGGKP